MVGLGPFEELMRGADDRIDLARACLLVAQDAYPALDIEHYLAELERMAARLRTRLPQAGAAEEKVIALNQFLYEDLGYWGNTGDYYDPRNSYLNDVIERRTGIPITLAVLYMEIGRRIGLPVEGVSFPGHFLVRVRMRRGMLVLDPFAGGVPQSEDELHDRLKRVVPRGAAGSVPPEQLPLDQFLEPATNRQILGRLLRNLKGIHREKDEPERLLQVLDRMLIVAPDASAERRDRGMVYYRLECWRPALQDIRDYVEREPEAPDTEEMRARIIELADRCAKLN